jgi:arylformamidase
VDLTATIRSGMRGVEFEPRHSFDRDGWNSRILHLYSHSGTHMDAPLHFNAGDRNTIDRIDLSRCIGPAWVADLPEIRPRESITVSRLGAVAEQVRPNDGLLLRTGWSRHLDQPDYFRNELPRVSRELAEWCVERRVRLLGVEAPSVADVNCLEEITEIHRILLENEIVIVEGLQNLEGLSEPLVLFCAAPLKVEGGDGAPCRAFAMEGLSWPDEMSD